MAGPQVRLSPIKGKVEPRDFSLDHANRLFEWQKANPPATWKLTDEKYQLTPDGKIEQKPNPATAQGT